MSPASNLWEPGTEPVGAKLARDEGTSALQVDRMIVHRGQALLPQTSLPQSPCGQQAPGKPSIMVGIRRFPLIPFLLRLCRCP
ncbi:hypothetical protein EMIT0P228_140180 [Pseudomonas brassicacearum]